MYVQLVLLFDDFLLLQQNMWTGEVDGACPTAPARTGMLVNSRSLRDNDEDVVFRDSSM